MLFTVYITPAAIKDIAIAVEYYNEKSPNLGYRFADNADSILQKILLRPHSFSVRYKNVRGVSLYKFPYVVLYSINETHQRIEVLRVFNTYQNPFW